MVPKSSTKMVPNMFSIKSCPKNGPKHVTKMVDGSKHAFHQKWSHVFYGKMVPKLFIHNEYNTAIIENILKRQKTVLKQIKKEVETYKRSTIDPRAFVILDDCLYDDSWSRDKMMRLLFMNGEMFAVV